MIWEFRDEIIAESAHSSRIGNVVDCSGFDIEVDINDSSDIIYIKNECFVKAVVDSYIEEFHFDIYDIKVYWNNSDRFDFDDIAPCNICDIINNDERISVEDEELLNSFLADWEFDVNEFTAVLGY